MRAYKTSRSHLDAIIEAHDPDIIHLQETWLKADVTDDQLGITGYSLFRRDRCDSSKMGGGGLLSYFKKSLGTVQLEVGKHPSAVEVIHCSFSTSMGIFRTFNIYIPPKVCQLPSSMFLGDLAVGDFNAHHESWSRRIPKGCVSSGRIVNEWIINNGLAIEPLAPSIPAHGTTPDLLLHSPQFKCLRSLQIDAGQVNSDHTPIVADFNVTPLTVPVAIPAHRIWFKNSFTESHWSSFSAQLDSHCFRLKRIRSLNKLCDSFVRTIESVAIDTLPNKWHKESFRVKRKHRHLDPELILIDGCKKGFSWTYKKLRELKGESTVIETPQVNVGALKRRFFPDSSDNRPLLIPHTSKVDFSEPSCSPFTMAEAQAVFNSLKKSDGSGPDSISNNMIYHFGDMAKEVLLRIANWSFQRGTFPKCLKVAHVLPILKGSKKDPTDAASYRPISLTSVVAKFIESLVHFRLEHLLISKLDPKQSGFVPGRSAEENIAVMIEAAAEVKNNYEKCATMIFFDISGAFDNVDHHILMSRLTTLIPVPYVRWIGNFLSDRVAHLLHGHNRTGPISCKKGVPQGSILGPLLFRVYVNSLPDAITADLKLLYADDLTVFVSGSSVSDLESKANNAIGQVENWLADSAMSLSLNKTEFLAFGGRFSDRSICRLPRLYFPSTVDDIDLPRGSADFIRIHQDDGAAALLNFKTGPVYPLAINGNYLETRSQLSQRTPKGSFVLKAAIPLRRVSQSRYLGIIIDDDLSFTSQLAHLSNTLKRGIGLISIVSSFKIKTEVLRQTIYGLILSRAYYGLASYAPYIKQNSLKLIENTLRSLQLRLTGCSKSTSSTALSVESSIPPFKLHVAKVLALSYERFLRLPDDCPTRSLVHPEKSSSWKLYAEPHAKTYVTPNERSMLCLPHHQTPWGPPPDVIINSWADFRKSMDPCKNLLAALGKIKTLPKSVASLYTDASYFQDKESNYHCGNAAVLIFGKRCIKEIHRYDPSLMIYNAEQQALLSAVNLIEKYSSCLPSGRINIITDSQSALRSLERGHLKQHSATNAELFRRISLLQRPITLQFVPSHCGIIGNEMADSLANKAAASAIPLTVVKFDYRMTQCSVNNKIRRNWYEQRSTSHVHSLSTMGRGAQRFHPDLNREGEMQIARLRTGHHPLVKQPRKGLSNCLFCNKRDTDTHHLLSKCPETKMFVQIHFPQMVFNDQDEDVGQHLHKFFATENQLALISLLNDLRSLHDSFPLRRAVPRQRLVKYLSVHSTVTTLDSKCKEEVRKLISEVYNANEIEKVYDHLWDLELYCFLNSDKNKNQHFNSFLEKIRSSKFTRIDPVWFDSNKWLLPT